MKRPRIRLKFRGKNDLCGEPRRLFTNISAYQFASLDGLKELRSSLLDLCRQSALKGTILLAPEGINLFVAGDRPAIDRLLDTLKGLPQLADLDPKFSLSQEQPFSRMLVRLKKEIIAFGVEGIDPRQQTAPRLSAATLKAWLDEKRPIHLLDTRNDYEVRLGTFRGAIATEIGHFRDFPEAARRLPQSMKRAPVVTFCTGGIRCEKAAPLLQQLGFQEVWQLDGGILRYFEEVGAAHFQGECFVFDRRAGVDPALSETDTVVCYACQAPLTAPEQADSRYRPGISCPFCFRPADDSLERSQKALDQVCSPLPGSTPAENRRPLRIPGRLDGYRLQQVLGQLFPQVAAPEWAELCSQGRLQAADGKPACLDQIVRGGEQFWRVELAEVEPDVNAKLRLLYQDEALLVLDKPAPLPMHSCGRFHRNTLRHFLQLAWHPQAPRPVHRLDANTTGVVICARTHHFARLVQGQFARGEVDKRYLARVQGHPPSDSFVVDLPIADEPQQAGIRAPGEGSPARTEFTVLNRDPNGTSLLEARLNSGRTNQIRAHLWHCGLPVVGDPAYKPGGLGHSQTLSLAEAPMLLHSWKITLSHPLSKLPVEFSTPPPWT